MSFELTYQDKKHGWWSEDNATVPCAVSKDGAVVVFYLRDVEALLDQTYPHNGRVWFFNETKDREIAERRGDKVLANPQVLWRHYLPKLSTQVEPEGNNGNVPTGNADRASISDPHAVKQSKTV